MAAGHPVRQPGGRGERDQPKYPAALRHTMLGTGILIANGNQLAGDRGHWWRAPDWPVARME